jgi:predicted AlkP superfamily phosphohydrolase/phosphomutase/tetratricopeptide (TPR) repeat protein
LPERLARRVALVGWDAAEWKIINPLLDRGLMPNLKKLVENGVAGRIATLSPALSPILWTSIATGKTGDQHEILGFLEPDPIGGGVRPVSSTSRKSRALWNILDQEGLRSLVINWFASHPAERIAGACVSNAFPKPSAPHHAPWPLPPETIHPAALAETLAELRVHAGELTGDDLMPFIPNLAAIEQETDKRPLALGAVLSETISTHAATTWLMENEPWDFLAVYFDAIDRAGHVFMRYHAPRMDSVSEQDFDDYKDVMNGLYCFHDLLLGRIVELAGPDAHVMVVSDHGFESGDFRPTEALASPSDKPLRWHRSHGVFCMAGPGIRKDELVYGAGLLDIAPTVLTLFGLNPGADMPGRPLTEAFEEPQEIERVPTWERPDAPVAEPFAAAEDTVWDAAAVLAQLEALGYIDTISKDSDDRLKMIRVEHDLNLAKIHMSAGRYALAIPLLKELARESEEADLVVYQLHLAQCYSREGRVEECRAVAEEVLARDADRPAAHMIRGNLAFMEGDVEGGLAHLLKAEQGLEHTPHLQHLIGRVYLRSKLWTEAERSFRKVIEFDPDAAESHGCLARSLLEQGLVQSAADEALLAIGLKFDMPATHFVLGVALARLGLLDRAERAFETCLALAPQTADAHDWLARIRSVQLSPSAV